MRKVNIEYTGVAIGIVVDIAIVALFALAVDFEIVAAVVIDAKATLGNYFFCDLSSCKSKM